MILEQCQVRVTGRGHRTEGEFEAKRAPYPAAQRELLLQLIEAPGPRGCAGVASLLVFGTCPCGKVIWGNGGAAVVVSTCRLTSSSRGVVSPMLETSTVPWRTSWSPLGTGLPQQAPVACGQGLMGPAVPHGSAWHSCRPSEARSLSGPCSLPRGEDGQTHGGHGQGRSLGPVPWARAPRLKWRWSRSLPGGLLARVNVIPVEQALGHSNRLVNKQHQPDSNRQREHSST